MGHTDCRPTHTPLRLQHTSPLSFPKGQRGNYAISTQVIASVRPGGAGNSSLHRAIQALATSDPSGPSPRGVRGLACAGLHFFAFCAALSFGLLRRLAHDDGERNVPPPPTTPPSPLPSHPLPSLSARGLPYPIECLASLLAALFALCIGS